MFNIITVLLIVLISFSIWNLLTLRKLKKQHNSNVQMTDDRYYELKYKMEYITTIVIVVLSVGGYFGYQWFGSIKDDAAKNLQEKTKDFESKLDSVKFQLNVADYKINNYDGKFTKFNQDAIRIEGNQKDIIDKQKQITSNLKFSKEDLGTLSNKIDVIKNKNILKQNFYIIEDIIFNTQKQNTFYFKNLSTTTGDKLPVFNKAPFISVSSAEGINFNIKKITTEYIELEAFTTYTDNIEVKFSIMLSEQ